MSPHLHPLFRLHEDLQAARNRDPAARSSVEVGLGYPGVHAIWAYRLTHSLWPVSYTHLTLPTNREV